MTKKLSYPPLIILLDILFIFLFILILDNEKKLVVNVPKHSLFHGAEIIFKRNNTFYMKKNNQEYTSLHFNYLLICEQQKECVDARSKYGEDIYILLPDKIFSEISRLTVAILSMPKCNSKVIEYFITKNGNLNYVKTLASNPCLSNIPKFLKLVDKK